MALQGETSSSINMHQPIRFEYGLFKILLQVCNFISFDSFTRLFMRTCIEIKLTAQTFNRDNFNFE